MPKHWLKLHSGKSGKDWQPQARMCRGQVHNKEEGLVLTHKKKIPMDSGCIKGDPSCCFTVIAHVYGDEHGLICLLHAILCCGPDRQRAGSCTYPESPRPALRFAAVKPRSVCYTLISPKVWWGAGERCSCLQKFLSPIYRLMEQWSDALNNQRKEGRRKRREKYLL